MFDSRSIHIGLFAENENERLLVGYSRLIIPPVFQSKFKDYCVKKHHMYLSETGNTGPTGKLALMNSLSIPDASTIVNDFCKELEDTNEVYCETSRFIIEKHHRSIGLSGFFVSSMIAISYSLNISYCFFQVDPHHIAFYKKFGINLFPNLDSFETQCYGRRVVIFGAVINAMMLFQKSILPFTNQFAEKRQIAFNRAA